MGTTSGATSALFSGTSQFSKDFQNVVTRAVNIASLPIALLDGDKAVVQSQVTALNGLDSKFAALQTALDGIGQAVGGGAFEATVSHPNLVSATLSDGALEGNYTIQVNDIGAYATSLSKTAWDGSGQHTYQVWIGATTKIDITPWDNSAGSVAAAINAKAGDQVRATVMNTGTADEPDLRISLQGRTLGDLPVDIVDIKEGVATSLQDPKEIGAQAEYIVGNSGNKVHSSSRTVQIADGVTVSLLSSDSEHPVDVTVMRSTAALAGALDAFGKAYNDAADSLDQQRGSSGGALGGQSLVYQLQQALAGIATYSEDGGFGGLTTLGLELGRDGKMTFSSLKLLAADMLNSTGVTAFLGSSTSGGFLKAASAALDGVENVSTGFLKTAEAAAQSQVNDLDNQIAKKQDQVDQLQQRLQEQMSIADAAISAMEQRYSYITGMFQAMQTADQQYK